MPTKRKTADILVPFENGHLLHYARRERGYGQPVNNNTEWRPNTPFQATLHLLGTIRGYSAAYFEWADDDGHRYPMFITDVAGLLQSAEHVDAGRITATWMVQKRGANFGIRLAKPEEIAAATAAEATP